MGEALARNGIHDRNRLAQTVPVGRATVYSSFDPDWSGVATHSVLAAVAGTFGIPIGELAEPVEQRAAA